MRRLLATTLVLLVSPLAAQATPAATDPIARFAALDFRRQAAIVRTVERQLAASADPAIQRIGKLRLETADLPDAPDHPPIFEARKPADGDTDGTEDPGRTVVPADDPAHAAVRKRMPRVPFLDDLRREVVYDWQSGRVEKCPPLEYGDRFANWIHGYAPATDHAIASILATLDRDPRQRKLAAWFGHTYCDLNGRAYQDVTLYEAWFSGQQVDVPDIDAIPFARDVLGQRNVHGPLGGPPRDALYEAIRKAALEHRRYRTALEAAAAAFVAADPELPADYGRLVPRFHLLWANHDDDPKALATLLASSSRDELLRSADDAVRATDGEAFQTREARRAELERVAETVRATALAALERFAGGG